MCTAPHISLELLSNGQASGNLGLQLDGVDSLHSLENYVVTIHPNPTFQSFGTKTYISTDTIYLTIESKVELYTVISKCYYSDGTCFCSL